MIFPNKIAFAVLLWLLLGCVFGLDQFPGVTLYGQGIAGSPVVKLDADGMQSTVVTNDWGMEFVKIPSMSLGDFYLQETELLGFQLAALQASDEGRKHERTSDRPGFVTLDWPEDIEKVIAKLNANDDQFNYRLPTVLEWLAAFRLGHPKIDAEYVELDEEYHNPKGQPADAVGLKGMLCCAEEVCAPARTEAEKRAVVELMEPDQKLTEQPVILGCMTVTGGLPGNPRVGARAFTIERVKFLHDGGTEPHMTTGIRLVIERKQTP